VGVAVRVTNAISHKYTANDYTVMLQYVTGINRRHIQIEFIQMSYIIDGDVYSKSHMDIFVLHIDLSYAYFCYPLSFRLDSLTLY
jgi:hypothetical protein